MNIGVVGATGLVGVTLVNLLESTNLPIDNIHFFASKKSVGKNVKFRDKYIEIEELNNECFDGIDIVFFCTGKHISKEYAPIAASYGCTVIDNSNAFRLDENIPLVVPEVNLIDIKAENQIIANPNCSTIQMIIPLHYLSEIATIKRVNVTTYQALSGSGKGAIDEFHEEINNSEYVPKVLPVSSDERHYHIFNNCIPQIDVFTENMYTLEELKMVNETKKILHNDNIEINPTCVRIPVIVGHSEAVTIEFDRDIEIEEVKSALTNKKGIVLYDDITRQLYPMPTITNNKKDVYVGRIRHDLNHKNIVNMWIVADNLLKGAAWNALQIAEELYLTR